MIQLVISYEHPEIDSNSMHSPITFCALFTIQKVAVPDKLMAKLHYRMFAAC